VRRHCEILGLHAPVEARITGQLSIDDLRAILDADDAVEPASPETAACVSPSDVYWVEGTGFLNASTVGRNTLVTGGPTILI